MRLKYFSPPSKSRWFLLAATIFSIIIFGSIYKKIANSDYFDYDRIESPKTDTSEKENVNLEFLQLEEGKKTKKIDRESKIESFAELKCPPWDDEKINVHFILHTHDDPGWLKTPEEYYQEDVFHIINAAIKELIQEPQRRFVYSELYFFNKFWNGASDVLKNSIKKLVKNGQLEFVGGGWVQNDDASTHYTAAIDQLTYGWSKIDDYFGEKALPKTGWQIDCFGYSQEQADIFQQMGVDEEVIVRLHYNAISWRRISKEMEFLWKTSPSNDLFTHVLYDHYTSPQGYQFEAGYEYKITDKNQEAKVLEFFNIVRERSKAYRTNHLLQIMGNDFVFKNAAAWFQSMDYLIKGGNLEQLNGSNIQLFYSTPSCYFKAVRDAALRSNITWPSHSGDFFPYATSLDSYWTGYFSSRTPLKRLIRMANNMLLTAQNLAAPVSTKTIEQYLNLSREALYTTLHHDGITGTCKQEVADEYTRLALKSISYSEQVINLMMPNLAGTRKDLTFEFCPLINVSVCGPPMKSGRVNVFILNGFSHERSSFIRLPIDNDSTYALSDSNGEAVPYQILPVTDEIGQFDPVNGRSNAELGFFAHLPALGFESFKMEKRPLAEKEKKAGEDRAGPWSIENEYYKLEFDSSGRLAFLVDKKRGDARQSLVQNFFWYSSERSGAYMLRPTTLNIISNGSVKLERIQRGPLVEEVRQKVAPWLTQIIRLLKNKPYIEFEWTVGPLPLNSGAKEIITRFSTQMETNGTFYTDANGRRLIRRKRDSIQSSYPLSANYYPTVAVAAIQDQTTQLSLITDRALGASSVEDGSLELIVYRKVIHDDGAGMGEGLEEQEFNRGVVVRGKIWMTISSIDRADVLWRRLAKEMYYEPILAFSTVSIPKKVSLINDILPDPVHVLTLQRWENHCLLRFEHFQSTSQDHQSISLGDIQRRFRGLKLSQCFKTQLGGWNRNALFSDGDIIRPMDIITYKCNCQ